MALPAPRRSLAWLAPAALGAAVAIAAEPPAARFAETVEVRLVEVEVFVADARGRPVVDLERGDFEVRVDGRPVEISSFSPPAASPPPPPATLVPPEETGVADSPAAPGAAGSAASGRERILVWLDEPHLDPGHRDRALRALRPLLEARRALGGDVLLVDFDRSLRVVRGLGDGDRPLGEDLAWISTRQLTRLRGEGSLASWAETLRETWRDEGCGEGRDDLRRQASEFAMSERHRARESLGALGESLAALAGLPGRKVLLYLADGLPVDPGGGELLLASQLCGSAAAALPSTEVVDALRAVTSRANAAGIALYAIQTSGLAAGGNATTDGGGLDGAAAMMAGLDREDGLFDLAEETGGRASLGRNDLAPLLEGLRSDLDASYALGFAPPDPRAGRHHRLEIRLRRPGLRVRHRSGYQDLDPAERRADRLAASLRFGGGLDELAARVALEAPVKTRRRASTVPVQVLIPASRLLFAPSEAGATAEVEITASRLDDEGNLGRSSVERLRVRRADLPADLERAVCRLRFRMSLPRGLSTLAVAVRDLGSDATSVLRARVDVR